MSAPPSKQLSANAPEFVPRGYTTLNIVHDITNNQVPSQPGNFPQQQQQQQHHQQHHQPHHHQQQQQPHHQHHHAHLHHHNHGQQGQAAAMRDLPHQMNSMRLSGNSGNSVQDRLQMYRGGGNGSNNPGLPLQDRLHMNRSGGNGSSNGHQQQQQYYQHPHPQPHHYNNMHNQQFPGRGGGGGGGNGTGGGYNKHHHQQHYNNSQQQQHRYVNGGGGGGQQQHPQSRHSSQQHSNTNMNANVNMQHQQVHQQHQQQQQQNSTPANSNAASSTDPNQQTEEETFAVNYVESLINCLNENPGSFDSITATALTVFEGFGANEYILSNAMEMIFNRSIEEQNFRYMGAKLYGLLDLIDLREDSSFRMLLNLKLEYHRNEILKYMQNEQSKVRGTTLFLAELYMQLRNDGNRIKDIAQNIVFSINQLLRKTTPENMKCICMTLKLAGYDLEFDCPADMKVIIQNLTSVTALDVSTSRILENVLNLQKNKWGRMSEPPAAVIQPFNNANSVRLSDDPVFYGPDGQILTEEESNFLVANLAAEGNAVEGSDSDLEVDPEMDAETRKAYKAFLKQQELQQHL